MRFTRRELPGIPTKKNPTVFLQHFLGRGAGTTTAGLLLNQCYTWYHGVVNVYWRYIVWCLFSKVTYRASTTRTPCCNLYDINYRLFLHLHSIMLFWSRVYLAILLYTLFSPIKMYHYPLYILWQCSFNLHNINDCNLVNNNIYSLDIWIYKKNWCYPIF